MLGAVVPQLTLFVMPATGQIEEVLITAQRREETLSQSPLAISVLDRAALYSGHIRSSADLATHLANVEVAEPLGNIFPVFIIRGVGLNDYNTNNNPTVGVYQDDAYLSSNAMIPKVLFDLERVEVVKGPQGPLYGRNTTGGAVNLLSAGPGSSFNGYAIVGYGNYNTVDMQAAIGGPITEKLGLRLAGFAERRFDGYQLDRTTGHRHGEIRTWGLRGTATYSPTDDVAFRLTFNGGKDRSDVQRFQHRGVLGPECAVAPDGVWNPALCFDALGYHDTDDDKLAGDYSLNPRMDVSHFGTTLKAEWTPATWTLTSITNAEAHDDVHGNEEDSSQQTFLEITYNSSIRQVSQELRLTSAGERRVSWLVGGFIGHYEHREHRRADITGAELTLGPFVGTTLVDLPYRQLTTTAASFMNVRWQMSAAFRLEGGLRYTSESISYHGGTVLPLFDNAPIVQVDDQIDDANLSWRVNLSYAPREGVLLYTQVSTGFKSGGFFGGFAFSPDELRPYRPETVTGYEVGARARVADTLTVDGAAFFYDYEDPQAVATSAVGDGGSFTIPTLTNIPGAQVYGAEFNFTWAPTANTFLRTGLGLLDSEIEGPAFAFGSAGAAGPIFDLDGKEMPRAPHVSLSATFSYTYNVSSLLDLITETTVAFRSKTYTELNNFPMATQAAYATLNSSIRLVSGSGWDVAAWVRNLTNVMPYLADANVGFGERDLIVYGMPRTFGVTARLSF